MVSLTISATVDLAANPRRSRSPPRSPSGPTVSYSYHDDGNLHTEIDSSGTYTYSYDRLDGRSGETLPGPRTLAYTYDANSHLASITDPSVRGNELHV
jgi:YD repeat-containing protein